MKRKGDDDDDDGVGGGGGGRGDGKRHAGEGIGAAGASAGGACATSAPAPSTMRPSPSIALDLLNHSHREKVKRIANFDTVKRWMGNGKGWDDNYLDRLLRFCKADAAKPAAEVGHWYGARFSMEIYTRECHCVSRLCSA
jgi:hypothetical protein